MGPRKAIPTPVKSQRDEAWRDTEEIFKKLKYQEFRGEGGYDRVAKIFDRSVGQYLDTMAKLGRNRWEGPLKRFILSCMNRIADELREIDSQQGDACGGASPALVQAIAVKWMREYKDRSKVCNAEEAGKLTSRDAPSARHGAVCDPFLDSL